MNVKIWVSVKFGQVPNIPLPLLKSTNMPAHASGDASRQSITAPLSPTFYLHVLLIRRKAFYPPIYIHIYMYLYNLAPFSLPFVYLSLSPFFSFLCYPLSPILFRYTYPFPLLFTSFLSFPICLHIYLHIYVLLLFSHCTYLARTAIFY